ncbi:hypothetical protein QE390_002683 [Siphonobacter sp. SORGH_AS 1065]|nr:hypothetical protein [Siphonobacter sp. SORGH_AS_1065]
MLPAKKRATAGLPPALNAIVVNLISSSGLEGPGLDGPGLEGFR